MKGFILPRSSARTPNPRLTQSQELYSQPLTSLRSRLDALERGSSHSRDRQHLATSARQLASRFDENVPSHELVIRDVLVVAIHALGSEGEVQELRRIQTQFVRFAGGGTVSGEEVRRYTKDILSQIMVCEMFETFEFSSDSICGFSRMNETPPWVGSRVWRFSYNEKVAFSVYVVI
jgi:hypothetical protein